jgi:hypothetical protein
MFAQCFFCPTKLVPAQRDIESVRIRNEFWETRNMLGLRPQVPAEIESLG